MLLYTRSDEKVVALNRQNGRYYGEDRFDRITRESFNQVLKSWIIALKTKVDKIEIGNIHIYTD